MRCTSDSSSVASALVPRCLFLLVAWAAILGSSFAAAEEWTGIPADQVISYDDNEYARAVQIAYSDAASSLHVLWGEDAPSVRELHYGRSIDEGATWTSEGGDRPISFPDGHALYEECDVAVALGGQLVVVWSEDADATREVHFGASLDDGLSWSCATGDRVLSDPTSAIDTSVPSIACDPSGTFHVVWHQIAPGGVAEVHYGRSADNGATWTSQAGDRVISFPDGRPALNPVITASGNMLYVVWRENDASGLPRIHLGNSADGGVTWSSETGDREISPAATIMTDCDVSAAIFTAENGIACVYRASFDTAAPYHYEIFATCSFDAGQTWTGESLLTPVSHDEGGGRSASNPAVFVSDNGSGYCVWDEEDDAAGTQEQHVSIWGGGWSGAGQDEIISFPDGEDGYRPSVSGTYSVTLDGGRGLPAAAVAWTEFTGGAIDNYEVHLSILPMSGGAVPEPGRLETGLVRIEPSVGHGDVRFALAPELSGAVTVDIFDAQGRRLRSLLGDASGLRWDGTDAGGRALSAGRYVARVRTVRGDERLGLLRY